MSSSTPARPDPDLIAAAVAACPSVAGLSGGVAGEAATYLPGRRVLGVRIDETSMSIHVVGRYGPTMAEISDEVARAVTTLAAGRTVGVVIEDLALPGDPDAATAPGGEDPFRAPGARSNPRVI